MKCFSASKLTFSNLFLLIRYGGNKKKKDFDKNAIKVLNSNINIYLHKITYVSSPKLISD